MASSNYFFYLMGAPPVDESPIQTPRAPPRASPRESSASRSAAPQRRFRSQARRGRHTGQGHVARDG
eukprot:4320983-Pyramimonas_sp.AAC.2